MVSARIQAVSLTLLNDVPPQRYIVELDAVDDYATYHDFTGRVEAICGELLRRGGESLLEDYHQLILLQLIADFEHRARERSYPESVREAFQSQFRRMLIAMQRELPGTYLWRNDSFCKDLGICRQRLIPCGVQLLERISGIPRSWVLRCGLRHTARMARTIASLGAFRPLYQFHTDRRQLKEFNPAGWQRCYGQVASLLRLNPAMRGVFCSTWWYDPEVARISPRLDYLRDVPEAGGAEFFCLGESEMNTANAIANSPERRRLHAEGTYHPKVFAMIWPRRKLLEKSRIDGWESSDRV